MFREGAHTEHPLTPIVSTEQRTAVRNLGTKLGPENRLICLSCHKLHHGKGERFMLADDLTEGRFCLSCHADKRSVEETCHDLRAKFPDERNRLGMTPHSGGPCSACHMFHRYARAPEISEVDPGGGKCITCHQEGRCAGTKTLGAANHPKIACVECHDPHKNQAMHFLRAPTGELCVRCHADYTAIDNGPHDYKNGSKKWPEAALAASDRCMACHRPHGDAATGLFRTPPVATAAASHDGACVACHPSSNWHASGDSAALHPQQYTSPSPTNELPLVSSAKGPAVGCRTCHNPHLANGESSKFVRSAVDPSGGVVCVTCHKETEAIHLTRHGPESLGRAGFNVDACLPCHAVHGSPGNIQDQLLWPKSLGVVTHVAGRQNSTGGAPAERPHTSSAYCVACHREGGPAKPPIIATHPSVEMRNPIDEGAKGFLPLFDARGRVAASGTISCRTCHNPHGHWPFAASPQQLDGGGGQSPEQTRGMRLMVRPFVAPNVCTTCHGVDALRRFLYFHNPQRRAGPLVDPAAQRNPAGS
jgi:predicted CXXCH cytochrome family protein